MERLIRFVTMLGADETSRHPTGTALNRNRCARGGISPRSAPCLRPESTKKPTEGTPFDRLFRTLYFSQAGGI